MKTGDLLKSLLDIADINQKTFAENMITSQSMVSKIINGKTLINPNEEQAFSKRAARILAQATYEYNCYFKFVDVFPVILDFTSQDELERFLLNALRFTIDQDRMADDNYPRVNDSTRHYSQMQQVLHMYCIICSDYLRSGDNTEIMLYSSLPLICDSDAEAFDRIRVTIPKRSRDITLYQLADPEIYEISSGIYRGNVLDKLFRLETVTDFYLRHTQLQEHNYFFLLKDKFIILINKQLDGTHLLTFITNKSELNNLSEYVKNIAFNAAHMSYSRENIQNFLNNPDNFHHSINSKIRALLQLAQEGPAISESKELLDQFLNSVLQEESSLFISADALKSFLFTDQILKNLFDTDDLSLSDRIIGLKNLKDYMHRNKPVRIYVTSTPGSNMTILCQDGLSLVCLINPYSQDMKFHMVDSNLIRQDLMKKLLFETATNATDYIDDLVNQAGSDYLQFR